jgi:hypothetical protein
MNEALNLILNRIKQLFASDRKAKKNRQNKFPLNLVEERSRSLEPQILFLYKMQNYPKQTVRSIISLETRRCKKTSKEIAKIVGLSKQI